MKLFFSPWKQCAAELGWLERCLLTDFVDANFHVTFWLSWKMTCQLKHVEQHTFKLHSSPSIIQFSLFQWCEGTRRPTAFQHHKKNLLFDPYFLCNHANTFTCSSAFQAKWVAWPVRKMAQMANVDLHLSVTVGVPSRSPLQMTFIWIMLMAKLSLEEISK